ncbi:hypothetical protein LJ737_08970 [Hymenobacter sp. 15J16-1T3B]|uniref:hypothetical protein n=1 Tax=Hymenobacter sp. 15J16-1T3B TaxID=2886941 RepID=UPI001D11E4CB|nr:hypothetical protein [Hymenobacter sp. 15J16-1T3B]MCC3157370.1 hypothetical protein [Hymenobacter sp. 15J16-1T3B]
MRLPLLLTASALFALGACQRGQPDSERDPTTEAAPAASPQQLAAQFEPVMRGVWVRQDYLAALARTQSPYQAAAQATDVVAMGISMVPPLGRSVPVDAVLNNHEGYDLNLRLQPGRTPTALPTSHVNPDQQERSAYELAYYLGPTDTTLRLNRYGASQTLRDAVRYQRVRRRYDRNAEQDHVPEVLLSTVRGLLFAGRYAATDSSGRTAAAELTADGQVRGLGPLRRYEPNLDFVVTLANDRDNMRVQAGKHARTMTYHLHGDTLRLYAARIVQTPEPQLLQGKLHYTLVRQR